MLNKATFIGNLGRDPEARTTAGGTKLASVSLAVKSGWGDRKRTDWVKLTIWGQASEVFVTYAKKGNLIYVEGDISVEHWLGKDGKSGAQITMNVSDFKFLGGGSGSESNDRTEKDHPVQESEDFLADIEEIVF